MRRAHTSPRPRRIRRRSRCKDAVAQSGVALPAGGVLLLPVPPVTERGAGAAERGALESRLAAPSAQTRSSPCGVEFPLGRAPGLAAGFTDGTSPGGGTIPAPRAQTRLAASMSAPLAPLPRAPAAALRFPSAVGFACGFAPGVAGAFGLASPLAAGRAETSIRCGRKFSTLETHAPREAFGGASAVALALIHAGLIGILVGHVRCLPPMAGIQTKDGRRDVPRGALLSAACVLRKDPWPHPPNIALPRP